MTSRGRRSRRGSGRPRHTARARPRCDRHRYRRSLERRLPAFPRRDPRAYGESLEQQIRDAAPSPVTAFIDCFGGYASLAHRLGVPGERVGTLVPTPAIALRRARFTGGRDGKIADIAAVAGLIDRGTVNLAIAGTYPFDVEQVRAAYTELMGGHVRGKIVITIP